MLMYFARVACVCESLRGGGLKAVVCLHVSFLDWIYSNYVQHIGLVIVRFVYPTRSTNTNAQDTVFSYK